MDWWQVAPVAIAVAFAVVYLIWQPRTVDLAAHTFRADLFGEEGFTIWNGLWYGGHHTPAYSVLSPPLAWLLSPALALAVAAVASAALFGPLARGAFGEEAARWGAIWFGVGSATLLFTARLPFALGVAFGLAALLALQRRRYVWAVVFAALCPLGQPGGRALPRDGRGRLRALGKGGPHEAGGGPAGGRRRVHPPGLLDLGLPGGRLGALPPHRLRAHPDLRDRLPAGACRAISPRFAGD